MTIQIGWTQNNATTIAYIAQYKAIAMKEMKRTGVPASITLAQGILESLEPILNSIIVTSSSSPRAMPVKELESLAIKIFGADRVFSNENLEGALKRAIEDAKRPLSDDSVGIVVTGSVVTVGEARSILRRLFSKED